MQKWLSALLILFLILPGAAASEPLSVAAKGAALIDADSGRLLFGQNENQRLPMASTTKIMTALLALESCSLDESVTAGKNAVGVEGTSIYLSKGETLSMEHMLYGLMLRSGNDAAVAIAEHVGGSVPAFVEKMNERAAELNADAQFANPHGLPAKEHAASALAMTRIMRAAMQNPDFRAITGTTRKVIPWVGNDYSRVLENKNRLLKTYDGAVGGKTGFTKAAGRCLVFCAERNGLTLIGAVLNCPTWFDTAAEMLDYGFQRYHVETPLTEGQYVGDVGDSIPVRAGGTLKAAVANGERWEVVYDYDEPFSLPLKKGDPLGNASLRIGSETVASCALLCDRDTELRTFRAVFLNILRRWLLS